MAPANLDGVRAKLNRAEHHFDCVTTAVRSFLGPDDYTQEIVRQEFQRDLGHIVVRAKAPKPVNLALSLAVGDCAHNLRSALDHLVLQLAVLNGTSAGAENKTAFPICLDAVTFQNATKQKVTPFIASAALTAIEELQPYRTIDPDTNAPLGPKSVLWVLSQLDIVDKLGQSSSPLHRLRLNGYP